MTVSDLLTFIGILLAIFAFVSERSREYVLLKFSRTDVILLISVFIYIHFLLSFDWLSGRFDFLARFKVKGFPSSQTYAYILSLLTIIWACFKIFWGKFPKNNSEKLLNYYRRLILKNEFGLLSHLIENYHLKQVTEFLQTNKALKGKHTTQIWSENMRSYQTEYSKRLNNPDLIYGSKVFYRIIIDDAFIDYVSPKNPYLFVPIIQALNDKSVREEEFVNRYLKVLFTCKNGSLFREIRKNQNLGVHNAYVIDEERPILHALFNDIKVASSNQAWRGVGEPALLEMYEEAKKQYSPLRESDREQQNDTIWSYRVTNAIWYFDIMVRQAIKQNENHHMWMFYYIYFVDGILANMVQKPPASKENRDSRNFDLITQILTNMMDWKDVMIKTNNIGIAKSIYDCLGQCLYKISVTKTLRTEDKIYLLNWVWEDLIMTVGEDETQNRIVEEITELGFKMFLKPSLLFESQPGVNGDERREYIDVINGMWSKRDVPKFSAEYGTLAEKFKKDVIDKLNYTYGKIS